MYGHDETKPWRYAVDNEGTVTRGRPYKIGDDHGDGWSHYWDSEGIVAFYDEGFRGCRVVDGTDEADGERAITAHKNGDDEALDRLAKRLGGEAARFIVVGLDRGCDLYVLSHDGDPNGEWRDEIEALAYGDVWRCETEEFYPSGGPRDRRRYAGLDEAGLWLSADDVCDEWYGEDKVEAEWRKMYPLDAFPAERFIDGSE